MVDSSEDETRRLGNQRLSVCYILGYYDSSYVRSRTLVAGLAALENVDLTEIRNTRTDWRLHVETLLALLRWRRANIADVYILGFRGHQIYWPVRLITRGRPLILDAFLSPSDALVSEGKHGRGGRLIGRILGVAEKQILRNAAHLLTDTDSHASFFQKRFRITRDHVSAIPVGASHLPEPEPQSVNRSKPLRLLYYGSMLPLHGLGFLIEALALLDTLELSVRLIGGSTNQIERLAPAGTLSEGISIEHSEWVPFDEILRTELPQSDLCLGGPFGATPQAMRVITGKTYQFLACSRATLVGRNADHEAAGFVHQANCLVAEQGDPDSIAEAIRWAGENRLRLPELGLAGKDLFDRSFSTPEIAARLAVVLQKVTRP